MREKFEKWAKDNPDIFPEDIGAAAWLAWQHQQATIDKLTAEVKRLTERCESAEKANERWAVNGMPVQPPKDGK
jgi:hypothetical protein